MGESASQPNLQRLEQAVAEKRFYEALQQYKAMYFRFASRKKAAEAVREHAFRMQMGHGDHDRYQLVD